LWPGKVDEQVNSMAISGVHCVLGSSPAAVCNTF
jgi:hypothetical protein